MCYAVQIVAKPQQGIDVELVGPDGWQNITEWEFDAVDDARELFDKVQGLAFQMYPWLSTYEQVEAYLWSDKEDSVEIKQL